MTSRHIETRVHRPGKRRAEMTPRKAEPHPCAGLFCDAEGCFGLGPPIQAAQEWFCPTHRPADYYERGTAT